MTDFQHNQLQMLLEQQQGQHLYHLQQQQAHQEQLQLQTQLQQLQQKYQIEREERQKQRLSLLTNTEIPTPPSEPISWWDTLRKNKLDKGAHKQATRIFPSDWRIEFKSPLLLISPPWQGKWDIKLEEAKQLVEATMRKEIHKNFVYLSDNAFVITTIKERSYYGKSCVAESGTGIVIIVGQCLIVGLYGKPLLATEFIPLVEQFASEVCKLGF